MNHAISSAIQRYGDYFPYVLPFAAFAVFTYISGIFNLPRLVIYPLKTIVVAALLWYYWRDFKHEIRFILDWLSVPAGVAVFFIWILAEGLYPQIGYSEFNPYTFGNGAAALLAIAFRLCGAVLVVPVMEEVFWRSFVLRFSVSSDFKSVPIGQFSWFSFIFVALLFGFEHHRWLVGIFAGMIYAGLLYRSKNLFDPIVSHAVTNLLLGIYVIGTSQWSFW